MKYRLLSSLTSIIIIRLLCEFAGQTCATNFSIKLEEFFSLYFGYLVFIGVFFGVSVLFLLYKLCYWTHRERMALLVTLWRGLNTILLSVIVGLVWFLIKNQINFDTVMFSYFGVEVVRIWWPADYLTTTLYEVVKEKFGPDVAGLIDYKGCIRAADNNLPNAVALALAQAAEVSAHFSPTIHTLFTAFGKPWVYTWGQCGKLVFVSSASVVGWGIWCFFVQKALIFTASTAWSGVTYYIFKKDPSEHFYSYEEEDFVPEEVLSNLPEQHPATPPLPSANVGVVEGQLAELSQKVNEHSDVQSLLSEKVQKLVNDSENLRRTTRGLSERIGVVEDLIHRILGL